MTYAAYSGTTSLTFSDYVDLDTGKTLIAEPREQPYNVAPASGRQVPDIPASWFTATDPPEVVVADIPVEAAEYDPGPVPGEPEDGSQQPE